MSTGQIHPSSCIIRPLINLEFNKLYKELTQHGAWVRSIGRISNAARIPLLSVAFAFQIAVLLPIRFVVTLLAEGIGRLVHGTGWTENDHYKNLGIVGMNFKGLCNSVINIIKTIDRTAAAAMNVLYSPPKEHESFGLEMIDMLDFGGVLTGIDPGRRIKKFLSKEPAVLQSLKNMIGWEPEEVINAREDKHRERHKKIMEAETGKIT